MIIAFATTVALMLNSCIQKHTNYGITGTPVINAQGNKVTILVAANEGTTHSENGGFRKTTYRTTYWLKQYETVSGKFIQKKKLLTPPENEQQSVSCYGGYDNKIWMYVNGITAYDINSLEEITNEKKIAIANGVKKTIFPYGDRLIYPSIENGYIDLIADNGDQYRLLLDDLSITKKELLKKEDTRKKTNNFSLLNGDVYGTRCDTLLNKVYIFAKDSSTGAGITPANTSISEVAFRMKLYSSNFSLQKLGSHTSVSYDAIQRLTETTFLNPCFIKDTDKDQVMHFSNPDGFMIIHQDVPGENSKALITKIDTNGKIIWEAKTGISTKISACIFQNNYCLIVANKDYMLSPHIGKDALCIVNTSNGNIIQPLLSE